MIDTIQIADADIVGLSVGPDGELAIDDTIYVVEATEPTQAQEIFSDGFESGNLSQWSAVAQ